MPSLFSILALGASVMFGAQPAFAQSATAAAPPVPDFVRSSDYRIGPGDELSIHVSRVREFEQSLRVSNSGRIRVPYVGIMFAAGKTTLEFEREIARAIREHELVNEPMVRVQVEGYRAHPVFVVGEVVTPGQFMITGDMYLLDVISRSGGLHPSANSTIFVYRSAALRPDVTARVSIGPPPESAVAPPDGEQLGEAGEGAHQIIPIEIDELQNGTRPELNIVLEGGDVVYVPRRPVRNFYIIGDVKVPGAYNMPSRGGVTAAQAIIYAGGPLLTAKVKKGFLMRHDENGVRQAIPVNFSDIIQGKKPDIPIEAEDIIYIPNSAVKTVAIGLLEQIPRLIQQFLIF